LQASNVLRARAGAVVLTSGGSPRMFASKPDAQRPPAAKRTDVAAAAAFGVDVQTGFLRFKELHEVNTIKIDPVARHIFKTRSAPRSPAKHGN